MSAIVPIFPGGSTSLPLVARTTMVRNVRKRRRPSRPARRTKRPMAKRAKYSTRYRTAASVLAKRKSKKRSPSDVAGKNISSTSIGRRLPRFWQIASKEYPKWWYTYNGAQSWVSDTGKQNYFLLPANMGWGTDLSQAEAATQQNAEFDDLINMQRKVGNFTNLGNSAGRLVRCMVRKSMFNMLITNQTDGYCMVTLYDIVCKTDCDASPLICIDQGLRNAHDNVAFPTSGAAPATVGVNVASDYLKMEPTQSPLFNRYYTILKRRSLLMNPGMVFSHTFTNAVNRTIDGTLFENTQIYKRGWFFGTLVRLHGMPANTADGAVTSIAPAKLAVVYTKRFKYQWLFSNQPYISGFQNLQSGVMQNMNEDGDIEIQGNA